MRREIELFFTALMFFTRIPVPDMEYSQEKLNKSSRYFPLVGLVVGVLTALIYMLGSVLLNPAIAVLLSMAGSILITGAFHEDGFCDTCDGFGGGYTKEKILEIMKDSRIGSYGAVGITLMLLAKFIALNQIDIKYIPLLFIAAHSISRLTSVSLLFSMKYVSGEGKSKPIAVAMNLNSLLFAIVTGILPLLLFKSFWIFSLLLPQILVRSFSARYFLKHIGGYTGDCLGAVQQIAELTFYISFIGLLQWKFI